jgi:anti-sigma factor ChrR (cupin superfamily)
MDAVTPKHAENNAAAGAAAGAGTTGAAGAAAAALAARHVRAGEMEWQKTRFPGCEVKTLLFDRASGLVTALMRFAPGAVLPEHEHVKIEQTFVLEGTLVDREGPDAGLTVPEGDFVWRPAGSRHSAWCPEGGLMLAIFQVPNKFFERDGRITDITGSDWEALWGRIGEGVSDRTVQISGSSDR